MKCVGEKRGAVSARAELPRGSAPSLTWALYPDCEIFSLRARSSAKKYIFFGILEIFSRKNARKTEILENNEIEEVWRA